MKPSVFGPTYEVSALTMFSDLTFTNIVIEKCQLNTYYRLIYCFGFPAWNKIALAKIQIGQKCDDKKISI